METVNLCMIYTYPREKDKKTPRVLTTILNVTPGESEARKCVTEGLGIAEKRTLDFGRVSVCFT